MTMRLAVLLAVLIPAPFFGQPTAAPTPFPVGRARGEDAGSYNVTNSFELGYRFHSVGGAMERYRSDVNFGNGIRLLGSRLTVNSKEGHGRLFDELTLTTQGLGNDPYEFANLRLRHNRFYQYDLGWRQSDYLNPGLDIGAAFHAQNTRRAWQDHDVTVLPAAPLQLLAGYSVNTQTGSALATQNLFDLHRGDEFPLFADVNRRQREFRLGAQIRASSLKLLLLRGWQRFEEQTPLSLYSTDGLNATDLTTLSRFERRESYKGDTPFWRLAITTDAHRFLTVNGALHYAGTRRDFTFEELAAGTNRLGQARNRQVMVAGSGRRPVTTGNLTLSLLPSERVTITNHSAYHQIQMDGDAIFREVNNQTQGFEQLNFRFLGIRNLVNASEVQYRPAKRLSLRAGYQFSHRRVRSASGFAVQEFAEGQRAEQVNRVHAALAGVRLQPAKPLSILLEGELGRANRPFLPISEKDYHAFGARAQFKKGPLLLSAASKLHYNTNSVSLFSHAAKSRNYALDASWTVARWFAFDAGYGKQHLDTLTGIAFFDSGRLEDSRSLYISNVHAGHAAVRFAIRQRADLSLGYSRIQDAGDGRARPEAGPVATFAAYQTFPLAFESPQARISIRIHTKLRWNLGYQHYRYREDFPGLAAIPRGYRAHTGYTSMLWSF